ncbi:MAG: ABC transporter ATP-binding protein [Actinobacteria bacterium]|nr:ABC transporter ATP-binding protein [Thermoleophilia bacterium]MCB9011038.1 ABC transporter ATP-binding protein [Actinomycetota bacterium]
MIETVELGVRRDSAGRGLDPITMRVDRGEIVLLRGPSGSGKSTLLSVLGGTFRHFHGGTVRGRARVAGLDVLSAASGVAAGHAALLFQDPEAQAVMATVGADVAFGPMQLGFDAHTVERVVAGALDAVDARHLASRGVMSLSSGERQRAAIASILAMATPVLLLDEPGSQLDAGVTERVAQVLRNRADELGTAILIADHTERFAHVADRALSIGDAPLPAMPGGARTVRSARVLQISGMDAHRGDRRILNDVHLAVHAGEVVAVVGDNGAGKSTLLRAIAGLEATGGGRVAVSGEDVSDLPAERRVPALAMVPQDAGRYLITESVADEIDFGLRSLGRSVDERLPRRTSALRALGVEHLAGRHPRDLSGGERERVAIAAAIARSPEVLLLDEPTRGMGRAARDHLLAALSDFLARGTSILVATHDEELIGFADRIVRVEDGRVISVAEVAA